MRLIADVDTGIDDAMALAHLVARRDVDLVGVSTTLGNTSAERAAQNTASTLAVCGRPEVPVWVGERVPLVVPPVTTPETHGNDGLGYAVLPDASRAIRSGDWLTELWLPELRGHPGETTLLVTGPLTNLAMALRAEPRLPELAARVVIMGGAFNHPGNTTPSAEWNIWCDPHAAAEVFAAFEGQPEQRLPIICSLGVTEQVVIRPSDLQGWAAGIGIEPPALGADSPRDLPPSRSGNKLVDLLVDALRFYFEFHLDWGYGYLAQMHDLLAAQIATGDVTGELVPTWVGVETASELTRGTTVADLRNLWHRLANARLLTRVDVAQSSNALTAAVLRLNGLDNAVQP